MVPPLLGTLTLAAENVTSAVVAPGCTPLAPNEVRSRSWSSHLILGKKFSSDTTHETLALGYTTLWKFVPKALFWSERTAPVRNSRSRRATCSCT